MAKGLAQRRRLKRALEAARGNLHKIQNGKALPLGKLGLPEAPKPQDAERIPASLRKMLALKELAEKQEKKSRTGGETKEDSSAGRKRARKSPGDGQKRGDEEAGDGPSTSGRQQAGAQEEQHKQAGKGGGVEVKGANAFMEQFVEKKLKSKKKEYLKRKAEKKRSKGGSGELVVEKELQLRDKVKFGEVVDAPLNVHLKRKHWADKEKTSNERCKEIFLKQMQQAQQRMAGQAAAADEGLRVGAAGKNAAGGAGAAAKGKKRKAQPDAEAEELRLQVIESYRAAKKGGGLHNASVGNATLSSLAHLVGKSGGGKAAAAGKTHTLA